MITAQWYRRLGLSALAGVALLLPACEGGGHFSLLGYTTAPIYDTSIRTVRVPIFGNNTYVQGLEFLVTEAVIQQINLKTPYRAVPDDGGPADTELVGRIISRTKQLTNFTQLGEVREAQTTLTIEVVWRDLRPQAPTGVPVNPLENDQLPPAVTPAIDPKDRVLVQSLAEFRPELGESITTANAQMANRMAVQIVSMMEKRW